MVVGSMVVGSMVVGSMVVGSMVAVIIKCLKIKLNTPAFVRLWHS
jgi:hypothetical protein